MDITMNLKIKVSIDENKRIGVENITNCVRNMELNKAVTKGIIEGYQDLLINEMCGPAYKRNRDKPYTRAGKRIRTIGTIFGKIAIDIRRVKDSKNKTFKPILKRMDFNGRKVYQRDICYASIDLATKLTYRDCKKEAELFTTDLPSPRTMCRKVHESLSILEDGQNKNDKDRSKVIMADGWDQSSWIWKEE